MPEVGQGLERGEEHAFDEAEIAEVIEYARQVEAITRAQLIREGLRWIAIPLILVLAVYLLLRMSQ